MKKKLAVILAIVLSFCMSIPVLAASPDYTYPTSGEPADQPSQFKIEKNYVTSDESENSAQFPTETLAFESVCTAAPMELASAPNLVIDNIDVKTNPEDIIVKVPVYKTPGKYNYKITEKSPSVHTPGSKDTAGVRYDEESIWIQVVVKYVNGSWQKFVTVTDEKNDIGAGNDKTQADANKKGDFKNKYLLDGETEPDKPLVPTPNPIPTPDPDPINPIPPEGGGGTSESAELAKFKIMKQVRGPLASEDEHFGVTVTLTSEKPVRSDITYNDGVNKGVIKKVGEGSSWTGDDAQGYTTTVNLKLKDEQTVVFSGMPADITYTVQENQDHIGALNESTLNVPSKGYTVAYYGGGNKVDNPTDNNPGNYGLGKKASGTIGVSANNNIIIANSKGMNKDDSDMVKPNTGIRLDSLPYFMILTIVVLGAGLMIVKGHRRKEE